MSKVQTFTKQQAIEEIIEDLIDSGDIHEYFEDMCRGEMKPVCQWSNQQMVEHFEYKDVYIKIKG